MRQRTDHPFVSGRSGSRVIGTIICSAVFGAVLAAMPGPASAASEVQGRLEDMQLRTENASTREVLEALSAKFKLRYKLPPNIGRNLTGLSPGPFTKSWGGSSMAMTISSKFRTMASRLLSWVCQAGPPAPPSAPTITVSKTEVTPEVAPSKPIPPLSSYR